MQKGSNIFFSNLINNFKEIFISKNIYWHILAWVLTFVIVMSRFDWYYFTKVKDIEFLKLFGAATLLGMLVPIMIIITLAVASIVSKSKRVRILFYTIIQSAFLGWLVSSIYKAFTGRVQPPRNYLVDTSMDWNFGFWQHGIFWGWPSSHTTVAFAMSFALVYLYPKNKLVKVLAIIYAFYIGIGITLHIHWFSEFVAGAIIGFVVGRVVGKSFHNIKNIV